MLATILWMALAASGGVLSGILYDKYTTPANPVLAASVNTNGKLDLMKTLKLIAIITAGAFALHTILKIFKIKIFGRLR